MIRHKLRNNDDRPLIEGSMDLANFIIQCSVDFLNRPGPRGVRLLEFFQSSKHHLYCECPGIPSVPL
jgi:hypothetical protein